MQEFNIGDNVRVKATGRFGVITDKMYSEARDSYIYVIKPDDDGRSFMRYENEIEHDIQEATYSVTAECIDGVVIGIVYKNYGDEQVELCRGHGHVIHSGDVGIVQAISYAFKMALKSFDDQQIYKK